MGTPESALPDGSPEGSDPEDAAVVRRVLAGDREAYRVLVQRYQDRLFTYALRMTSEGDVAADIVQWSLIRAYTRLDRCDPDRFGAWLYRIAANRCKDYLKSRRRRDLGLDDVPPLATRDDPERALRRVRLREALERAIRRLPAEQREAFVLKHVEGRSYEEMQEICGASVPALKMRVHRAREAMRVMLQAELE